MTRALKKTAFLLGTISFLTLLLHVRHADASHTKSGKDECTLCQTLTHSDAPSAAPAAVVHLTASDVVVTPVAFAATEATIHRDSRGPPSA